MSNIVHHKKNIWDILNLKDLISFLKNNHKSHITLCIVLNTTPERVKNTLKKFLLSKAGSFPNATFLYYSVSTDDFHQGKPKITLLARDKTKYPFIYCLYDLEHVLASDYNVSTLDKLTDCFDDVEQDYINHRQRWIKSVTTQQNTKPNNESEEQETNEVHQDHSIDAVTQKDGQLYTKDTDQPIESSPVSSIQNINQIKTQIESQLDAQKKLINDKKRYVDKLILLKQKSEQNVMEFATDICQRKQEEEKTRKKIDD